MGNSNSIQTFHRPRLVTMYYKSIEQDVYSHETIPVQWMSQKISLISSVKESEIDTEKILDDFCDGVVIFRFFGNHVFLFTRLSSELLVL